MATQLRVLIVDDSPPMRFILRGYLEEAGHAVVGEAEDQASALAAYAQHKPDVVTLDLSLVKGDGLSVLKALRAADAKARVLVVSANSQKKVVETVMASGAAGFLGKPIEPDALAAALARATQG